MVICYSNKNKNNTVSHLRPVSQDTFSEEKVWSQDLNDIWKSTSGLNEEEEPRETMVVGDNPRFWFRGYLLHTRPHMTLPSPHNQIETLASKEKLLMCNVLDLKIFKISTIPQVRLFFFALEL